MDSSWCPGCDRLILPKRYIVPVSPIPTPPPLPSQEQEISSSSDSEHNPPPPPAPTPVPSSPEVRKKPLDNNRARRLGGGLVHGTGRVRPGGGLKPRAEKKSVQTATAAAAAPAATAAPVTPAPAPAPAPAPKKTRIIISQDPTPLYCSEECRQRDLKNSYIESESGGFVGAPAARNLLAQLELVQETVQRCMQSRRSSSSSSNSSAPLSTPPVPPNSLADAPSKAFFRSDSMSSTSTAASSSSLKAAASNASVSAPSLVPTEDNTIRAPKRPTLIPRVPSWGSPTKAALAPPARTLFTYTASASSIDSSLSSIYETETMPSTSARSEGARKKKQVSFVGDSTMMWTESPEKEESPSISNATQPEPQQEAQIKANTNTTTTTNNRERPAMHPRRMSYYQPQSWLPPRRRSLLDADSLRAAVSVSPKDRIKPSSLPAIQQPSTAPASTYSASTPSLAHAVLDTNPRRTMSASNKYHVAMWPEDEKRMTESAKVHGSLLRVYAKKFGPREGRSLCYSALLKEEEEENEMSVPVLTPDGSNSSSPEFSVDHDSHPDASSAYWDAYESKQAEFRATRRAKEMVKRMDEERIINELLGGQGSREEDQPQARTMKRMAYDGMPGPPEQRGLEYRFDKFLYEVNWDGGRESNGERKRLFNFEE